jgi:hypothetical protein
MRKLAYLPLFGLLSATPGCFGNYLTAEEIRQAIDSVVLIGEARQAVDDVTEISTSFTIGDGLEAIVEQVRIFAESQAPCSTVDASTPGVLSIDFGGLDDSCEYNGRTYAGVVTYTFAVNGDQVDVEHIYEGFTNGEVTLEGKADVTWSGGARQIVTDFEIYNDDHSIDLNGDRTMTLINEGAGLAGGIEINGERRWTGSFGNWDMSIEAVEVRAQDPVPQEGRYELVTPRDILATLAFHRIDEDTIEMIFTGPRNQRVYHINSIGLVEDVTDE